MTQHALFSSLASFVTSSTLLSKSWDVISWGHGHEGLVSNKGEDLSWKVYEKPDSNLMIIAFESSLDSSQLGADLVPSSTFKEENFHHFKFLRTEKVPHFSVNSTAITLFHDNYEKIDQLKHQIRSSTQLIVTGLGLGGSVASLFTISVLYSIWLGKNRPLCITFGSPLIGDKKLQEVISRSPSWNSCFLHVVSYKDPVLKKLNPDTGAYMPFGTFLICSDTNSTCFENPESVLELLVSLVNDQNQGSQPVDYGKILVNLYRKAICKDFIPRVQDLNQSNSLRASICLQLEALGLTPDMQENNVKVARKNQQLSTESSGTSMSSSSPSSSMSSLEFNRTIQIERPSTKMKIPENSNSGETIKQQGNQGHQSLDLFNIVKESMQGDVHGLSVKIVAKEENKSHILKYIDSPSPLEPSKSDYVAVMASCDSPRLSYDGRNKQDTFKSTTKPNELPRLSLDRREGSIKSFKEGTKSQGLLKGPQKGYGSSGAMLKQLQKPETSRRAFSVVAKLMGLDTPPGMVSTSLHSGRDASTPRKQPEANQNSQLQASRRSESSAKASNPVLSVYTEIEKRIKDLEFKNHGKDLRALKQILEEMLRRGLLDKPRDQVSNSLSDKRSNDSHSESSIVKNQRKWQKDPIMVEEAKLKTSNEEYIGDLDYEWNWDFLYGVVDNPICSQQGSIYEQNWDSWTSVVNNHIHSRQGSIVVHEREDSFNWDPNCDSYKSVVDNLIYSRQGSIVIRERTEDTNYDRQGTF